MLASVDVALEKGRALISPVVEIESVDLRDASGRILAREVTSDEPLPRFDYSAMDGYAIDATKYDETSYPRLMVVGRIAASRLSQNIELKADAAIRILTGAPLPSGASAVIAQEDVRREGNYIVLSRFPRVGENIRRRGEDIKAGSTLIEVGRLLGPRELGLAASAGRARLNHFSQGPDRNVLVGVRTKATG